MAAIQSYFSQSFEIVEYIYHFEKLGLGVDSRMSYSTFTNRDLHFLKEWNISAYENFLTIAIIEGVYLKFQ